MSVRADREELDSRARPPGRARRFTEANALRAGRDDPFTLERFLSPRVDDP
jgi:hypothetical protein